MKNYLVLFLVFLMTQTGVKAQGLHSHARGYIEQTIAASELNPVEIFQSQPEAIKQFITQVYDTSEDKKLLASAFGKISKWSTPDAKFENQLKTLTVIFEQKYRVQITQIDLAKEEFLFNGSLVSLKGADSLQKLMQIYQGLPNQIETKTSFNLLDLAIPKAHALGPFALGFIAFTITSAAIATAGQMRRHLLNMKSKVDRANRVCSSLDEHYNMMNYDSHISEFESFSSNLIRRSSRKARRQANSVKSCQEIRDSWKQWFASWFYSIFNMTSEDWQEELALLCEKAQRVQGCIAEYRRRKAINGDERDAAGRRFIENAERRRNTAAGSTGE